MIDIEDENKMKEVFSNSGPLSQGYEKFHICKTITSCSERVWN